MDDPTEKPPDISLLSADHPLHKAVLFIILVPGNIAPFYFHQNILAQNGFRRNKRIFYRIMSISLKGLESSFIVNNICI